MRDDEAIQPFDKLIHRQAQDDPEQGRRVRAPSPVEGLDRHGMLRFPRDDRTG